MDCTRIACALLLAAVAGAQEPLAPEGFQVQRAVGATRSYLCLDLEADGAALLGTESQGLWRVRDQDQDGFAEEEQQLAPDLLGIQGLLRLPQAILAVARRGDESGLWRLELDPQGQVLATRSLLTFTGDDEHGAHGIVQGFDGAIYLVHGDAVQPATQPSAQASWSPAASPDLIEALPDPGGFGAGRRWPYGQVLRIDAESGAYEPYAVGLRNPYDLALRKDGEWFTVDSDMEWDLGLPWYRPVRALMLQRRGDYGARPGSAPLRAGWPDTLPAMAELGRGSPTGLVFVEHPAWPARWQGCLLMGDWSEGRVLALDIEAQGAGYQASPNPFIGGGAALPVTDLAIAADGALWMCSGGRGVAGSVWRILPPQAAVPAASDQLELALNQAQPMSAFGRASLAALFASTGESLQVQLREVATDPVQSPERRSAAIRAWALGDPAGLHAFASGCSPQDALAMGPSALAILLDAAPHSPVAHVAANSDALTSVRRAFARAGSTYWSPDQVLARSKDPWLLYARRHLVVGALASGIPRKSNLLHKNDWWFEKHLASPALGDAEASRDLASFLWIDLPAAERVRQLRTIQRIFASGAKLDPRVGPNLDERLRRLLKDESPAVVSLTIPLVAARAFPDAAAVLLDLIERSSSRLLAIDAAVGLNVLREGLNAEQRGRLFAFYEESAEWTGGGSFQSTLAGLLQHLVQSTPDGELRELAQADGLGGRALAAAIADRPALQGVLVPAMRRAWAVLVADESNEPAVKLAAQRGLLRALQTGEPATLAPLADWLRELVDQGQGLRDDARIVLARCNQIADLDAMVSGATSGRFDVREACVAYLLRSDSRPVTAGPIWEALAKARSLGSRTGARLAALVARWLKIPAPSPKHELWEDELLRLERGFGERYPDWSPPAPGPLDGPVWTPEQLGAFLERTASRPASSARGARVYNQLGCQACHVLGGRGGGWGPDLDGVTRRLEPGALLRALLDPSAEVADRYSTTRLTMASGIRHEGRIARETESEVEFWLPAGTRLVLERRDIVDQEPSDQSPMPAGLIDGASLEQLRDLMAHLAADGAIEAKDAAGAGWIDLLADANRAHWGGTPAGWRLVGKVLEGSAEDQPQSTYLVYDQPFRDFEVEFDVFAPDANSGLQYRSHIDPTKPDPVGYQADLGKAWWGSLFATDGRGAIAQPERILLKGVNWKGWNHYYLRIEGDRHIIELNGHPMVDARDDVFDEGLFALQLHQKMKMQVWFANLRVRTL